jgi:alanine-alpha-ketoisovalerate/valine-pyruvate aminotransferase
VAIPNLLYTAKKRYSALVCGALKEAVFLKLLNTVVKAFYKPKIRIAAEVSLFP